jgi:MYXO-CTERM domain-containing protein
MRFYRLAQPPLRYVVPALALALVALAAPRTARAQNQIKPRFVIMVDTSGSMDDSTGSGTNSCGMSKTKMNDAKCVLGRLNDSFGDVEFALGRFKQTTCSHSNTSTNHPCNWNSDNCDSTSDGSADRGEMLVSFGSENANDIGEWVNFTCSNPCVTTTTGTNDPELDAGGGTPLSGYIHTARRFLQGGDPTFGTNPISTDPFGTCRPYRVIMLTDGNVNCGSESQASTVTAIKELRKTGTAGVPEGVMPVDVRTDVIGFGISAGDADIEAYAHAGGRANGAGNEGFYATDEASLALAFSQIIQGSLLVEVCDGADNDCDGQVDEGFPINQACDGPDSDQCATGITVCTSTTTVGCNETAGGGTVEVCNGVDDDCDGLIDEPPANCPACTFQPEICDGIDNNCNNMIDEGLNRPCGTDVGACTAGTETCVNGNWVGCTAVNGHAETCNNIDDDCDGAIDGITRDCGQPSTGECQPGQQVCTAGGFGTCIGAIGPQPEGCDGLDNDCDGMTDEGVPGLGQPCGTACGMGTTACVMGTVMCVGGAQGQPEICNNVDDNCNGEVDEGQPTMGPCTMTPQGEALCQPGTLECVGGTYQCVGGTPSMPEICDCNDNDCDSQTDEGNLCGPGSTCLADPYCQCALPCDGGEFPCPLGFSCTNPTDPTHGFCVHDRCFGVSCTPTPQGEATVCVDGACEPACSTVTCTAPQICRPADGMCVDDNCNGFPERCTSTQFCVDGACLEDPCANVTCTAPEYCSNGSCIRSCAGVTCGPGEVCELGMCHPSSCAGITCPPFQVCDPADGMCHQDRCLGHQCPPGQACDPLTGDCGQDPCLGIQCPSPDQVCTNGSCNVPPVITNDGGVETHEYVSAAGSGCACQVGTRGGGSGPPLAGLLLVGAVLVIVRRRRGDRR